jgi:hypothetical protein
MQGWLIELGSTKSTWVADVRAFMARWVDETGQVLADTRQSSRWARAAPLLHL